MLSRHITHAGNYWRGEKVSAAVYIYTFGVTFWTPARVHGDYPSRMIVLRGPPWDDVRHMIYSVLLLDMHRLPLWAVKYEDKTGRVGTQRCPRAGIL